MTEQHDLVVLGTLVTPDAVVPGGWIAVNGETIAAIGSGALPSARATLDYGAAFVLPGLVDGHMHTSSSRGWAGIEGSTRSAAAGGVTTCVDMPYDVPRPVTDAQVFRDKVEWVDRTAYVDVALYATITKEDGVGAIPGLAEAGACSFKLSTYEYDAVRFPRIDHPTMVEAFAAIARTGLPVSIHNEDQELVEVLTARAKAAGQTHPIMHARTRPPLAETMADQEIFEIGLATGAHVHIAHSSVARGFDIAASFRAIGGKATGEACIQYLCLTEDDLVRLGGRAKCNPPVRTADEVERMWRALAAGEVAYVSTDHAPWPADNKGAADIFACGAGLTGLQSFAPLMFTLLEERGLPLTLMAAHCAERTARHHGLYPRKGALAVGSDADVVVLERAEGAFDEARIEDVPEMRWSPYHGRALKARVAATLLRGRLIWDGARVLGRPGDGRFVPRRAG